jgi:hypothetical protein
MQNGCLNTTGVGTTSTVLATNYPFFLGTPAGISLLAAPALSNDGNVLYSPTGTGSLMAIKTNAGSSGAVQLWQTSTNASIAPAASPSINVDGSVWIVNSAGAILSFRAIDGAPVCNVNTSGFYSSTPTYNTVVFSPDGSTAYVGIDAFLYAVVTSNCSKLWSQAGGTIGSGQWTTAAAVPSSASGVSSLYIGWNPVSATHPAGVLLALDSSGLSVWSTSYLANVMSPVVGAFVDVPSYVVL